MAEPQDYDNLLKSYRKVVKELETQNQALYDCKRQMKTAQNIEAEYQEEIKLLQNQISTEQQKCDGKVQQLQEDIARLRESHNEKVAFLEKELSEKVEEINELNQKVEDVIKFAKPSESFTSDKLLEEISEIKNHNSDIVEQNKELNSLLENSTKENLTFQEKIKQLEMELMSYKDILQSKKEELDEAKVHTENLKDEILCMRSELDSVKSQPLDDKSRGNSLFAEVDDRRVKLQQNMNTMKKQYMSMRQEKASFLKQITALTNQNEILLAQIKAETTERNNDEEMIIQSYKSQLQTQSVLLESYKKQLQEKLELQSETSGSVGVKFYYSMMSMKDEEMENLRHELSAMSLNHSTISYDLKEANRLNRKQKLEILELKNDIEKLKIQIEELKTASPVQTTPPVEVPKSIIKDTPKNEIEKENENVRKVQFTENTVEGHVTDRKKVKSGAKVHISKPVVYF